MDRSIAHLKIRIVSSTHAIQHLVSRLVPSNQAQWTVLQEICRQIKSLRCAQRRMSTVAIQRLLFRFRIQIWNPIPSQLVFLYVQETDVVSRERLIFRGCVCAYVFSSICVLMCVCVCVYFSSICVDVRMCILNMCVWWMCVRTIPYLYVFDLIIQRGNLSESRDQIRRRRVREMNNQKMKKDDEFHIINSKIKTFFLNNLCIYIYVWYVCVWMYVCMYTKIKLNLNETAFRWTPPYTTDHRTYVRSTYK